MVGFVEVWGDQVLAGNPLQQHEARRLEEGQVSVALQAPRSGRGHPLGNGALEHAVLKATQNCHLGVVAHHIGDAESR